MLTQCLMSRFENNRNRNSQTYRLAYQVNLMGKSFNQIYLWKSNMKLRSRQKKRMENKTKLLSHKHKCISNKYNETACFGFALRLLLLLEKGNFNQFRFFYRFCLSFNVHANFRVFAWEEIVFSWFNVFPFISSPNSELPFSTLASINNCLSLSAQLKWFLLPHLFKGGLLFSLEEDFTTSETLLSRMIISGVTYHISVIKTPRSIFFQRNGTSSASPVLLHQLFCMNDDLSSSEFFGTWIVINPLLRNVVKVLKCAWPFYDIAK